MYSPSTRQSLEGEMEEEAVGEHDFVYCCKAQRKDKKHTLKVYSILLYSFYLPQSP